MIGIIFQAKRFLHDSIMGPGRVKAKCAPLQTCGSSRKVLLIFTEIAGVNPERGQSLLEASLIAPWLLLMFAATFDLGFYAAALLTTQNAARVAALHASASAGTATDSAGACQYVLAELRVMPNARELADCGRLPLIVTAAPETGPDGAPAARVTVQYQTSPVIGIPGLLPGQLTITRSALLRIRSS